MTKQKLIVVLGQTATGKSDLAVRLAKKYNGEVISADSRQVYKGLDIGTGKITKSEMKGIPHHVLDVVSPKKQFSIAEYKKLAEEAIANIISRGKIPILCGGTGFYIQAIVDGIVLPKVAPNMKLRKHLNNKTTKQLYAILKKLDLRRAREIDKNNPRRLIRAIEIATSLGKIPHLAVSPPSGDILQIGLKLTDAELKKKITIRLFARISRGMINEARNLLHRHIISFVRMRELGLEYKYLAKYLKGELGKKEMIEQLETAIWHYAKRQKTWFKRDKRIRWFDVSKKDARQKIEKEVIKFLK
ncbi:MAG: tRNA (adenosine(37)-N6)-dimethylallyltransferase MiaA [Patescibacteria group bacterium]